MFYLCCIFCSFFKTFCTFEFAFHFIFMVFFLDWTEFSKMWIVNESSSWAMGWRNLKSREMISCDSCHESEELDSDCENKNPVTHFYDLKCMTHKYLFMVHMTLLSSWWPFSWWTWKSEGSVTLTFELRSIRTKTEYMTKIQMTNWGRMLNMSHTESSF